MRVLHLCPLWFPVSEDAPGGIETLLAGLSRALAAQGCEVTLLASGDSQAAAPVVPVIPRCLRDQMEAETAWEHLYYEQHQLHLALERAREFDLIHSHLGTGGLSLSAVEELGNRVLHSLHCPLYGDMEWYAAQHPELWFAPVSEFQAAKLRRHGALRCRPVPNGVDFLRFPLTSTPGEGLVFLGRMEWGKGPDLAVRVSRELGLPLTLAGPITDDAFFDETIRPYLDGRIFYAGVLDHARKVALLGEAACALLPFRGEEGFGLVSVEAMACGTPVVALPNGALPEIVESGITGALADDETDLAFRVIEAVGLNRAAIRRRAQERFDITAVAARYLRLYEEMKEAA